MSYEKSVLQLICHIISGKSPELKYDHKEGCADTGRLIKCLQYHQIVPLIHHYRREIMEQIPALSEDFYEGVKAYAYFNISRVMIYEHFLKLMDQKFKSHDIAYRLFKGLVTGRTVYQESHLRAFGDLDILIRTEDLTRVHNLLLTEGFDIDDDLYRPFPEEIIRKYSFARHYLRQKPNNIAIDIHLNLSGKLHPFQFDHTDFWDNSITEQVGDVTVSTFDLEHQAVYALYHAFKHYYFKLIWLIDVFKMVDQDSLESDYFIGLLKRYKLMRIWKIFLPIALILFGRLPNISKGLESEYQKQHPVINSDAVLNGILPYSDSRARMILPLYYLPGIAKKIRYLGRQLFPPKETVRDFYDEDALPDTWKNYLQLRGKAITGLIFNE